uniref:Uncharacterized protein n=1 Tax=Trypanosoma vivax (strain Y486) TaxID=1055687 RepID=G0U5L1_TRYVY|nr:hypothetical protein TVY486_1002150 [Trypanosoma vivax Y486]
MYMLLFSTCMDTNNFASTCISLCFYLQLNQTLTCRWDVVSKRYGIVEGYAERIVSKLILVSSRAYTRRQRQASTQLYIKYTHTYTHTHTHTHTIVVSDRLQAEKQK